MNIRDNQTQDKENCKNGKVKDLLSIRPFNNNYE